MRIVSILLGPAYVRKVDLGAFSGLLQVPSEGCRIPIGVGFRHPYTEGLAWLTLSYLAVPIVGLFKEEVVFRPEFRLTCTAQRPPFFELARIADGLKHVFRRCLD